ncbi:MAG: CocE/NonD family hydrolase, partial [Nannocystaceae bacterium]
LQLLDGYDIIETVAAQSWVKDNQVGMAGLSYPGISQIFVASTQPPSLAAITPLSVIADVNGTLVPGGILNDGFAISWADRVLSGAAPYGQGWEQDMIDAGDPECAEHQLLHSQAVDIIAKAYDNPFYVPEVADPINLNLLAPDIDVPVFLTGAWQDEQTGPNFGSLLDKFTNSPLTRFTIFNGVHPDGYTPMILTEWFAFLSLYVADEVPVIPADIRFLAPFLFESQFGEALELPPDRFADYPDAESARAAFEAEPIGRVIYEVGGAEGESPGVPIPAWEDSFDTWPPANQTARRWYLHEDGSLQDAAPTVTNSASQYTHQPDEGQKTNLGPGAGAWDTLPNYDWTPHAAGASIVFETDPLTEDLV